MAIFKANRPTEEGYYFIVAHASVMIFVFIFLLPCSIFPVRYHRMALNKMSSCCGTRVRQWYRSHLVFSIPIYPLILASMLLAKMAPREKLEKSVNVSTDIHADAGVLCHQVFAVEFFIGLFSYPFLLNKNDQGLRTFHRIANYLGILLSVHIFLTIRISVETGGCNNMYYITYVAFLVFQMCLHFFMTYLDTFGFELYSSKPEDLYLREIELVVQIRKWTKPKRSDQYLIGDPSENPPRIQNAQFARMYKKMGIWNMLVCSAATGVMIYYVVRHPTYYPAGTRNFQNFMLLGDFGTEWGGLKHWMRIQE